MDWTNLTIFVFATFMTIVTLVGGSVVVVAGWMVNATDVARNRIQLRHLYLFTIAVALDLLGVLILWLVPDKSKLITWIIFLIVAAGFIAAGTFFEFRAPQRPGRRLFKIGSVVILLANVIGIVFIVLSLLRGSLN